MRYRQAALSLILISLALAGCGGGDAAAPASPSPTSSSARPESWERIPEAQREEYIGALERIEPGLVVNEERALRRGVTTCDNLKEGLTENAVAERARQRFTGGNATVDAGQARRIVAAAKRWVCPFLYQVEQWPHRDSGV